LETPFYHNSALVRNLEILVLVKDNLSFRCKEWSGCTFCCGPCKERQNYCCDSSQAVYHSVLMWLTMLKNWWWWT